MELSTGAVNPGDRTIKIGGDKKQDCRGVWLWDSLDKHSTLEFGGTRNNAKPELPAMITAVPSGLFHCPREREKAKTEQEWRGRGGAKGMQLD
jgi:hypothetical protein